MEQLSLHAATRVLKLQRKIFATSKSWRSQINKQIIFFFFIFFQKSNNCQVSFHP